MAELILYDKVVNISKLFPPNYPHKQNIESDGWERTDDPVATTAVPPSMDPTYDLLDQDFDVTQSVLRMRRLRHELDRGGRDTS